MSLGQPVKPSFNHALYPMAFLILAAASMGWAVRWYYRNQCAAMETAAVRELSAAAEAERAHIATWRRERISGGRVFMASPAMPLLIRTVRAGAATKADEDALLLLLDTVRAQYGYSEALLAAHDGSVLIRERVPSPEQSAIRKSQRAELVRKALEANEILLSDINTENRAATRLITLTIPIDGKGALILLVDPASAIFPVLKRWPGASPSAESVLIRREGDSIVALSQPQFVTGPLPSSLSLKGMNIPSDAELEAGKLARGWDYRNVQVLAEARKVPDTEWFVVAKVDAAEVNGPMERLGREMAVIMTLLVLVLSSGGGLFWKNAQLRRRRADQERLESELAEKTQREAEIRALSARLIDAQEEERTRVSRELHDDLSQQIAALSIGMGNLKRGLPAQAAETRKQSDLLQQELVALSETVRRISHELHPAILQHAGLPATLASYCTEFEKLSGIEVTLSTKGEFAHVPENIALNIYRIVQEALRNVAKHANVREAEITLNHLDGEISLTVIDHGVGIGPQQLSRPGGLGLVSIRERTRLIHGTVEISSAPGQGTRLSVRIPDPAARAQHAG